VNKSIVILLHLLLLGSLTSFGQHHFQQGVKTYSYQLSQNDAIFHFDTIMYNIYSTEVELKVRNDLPDAIVIQKVHVSDGAISISAWSPRGGEALVPSKDLSIKFKTTSRAGPINRTITVSYVQNEVEKRYHIKVKGWVLNMNYYVKQFETSESPGVIAPPADDERQNTEVEGYDPYYYQIGDDSHVYLLSGNDRCLHLNRQFNYPAQYIFEIKNNTGEQINLDGVSSSNHQLVFFVSAVGEWTLTRPTSPVILPDSSFLVKGMNPRYGQPNKINTQIQISYRIKEKSYASSIPVSGVLDFKQEERNFLSSGSPFIAPKEKVAKEKTPTAPQRTYSGSPDGIHRWGKGNVTQHQAGQFYYEFTLDEQRFHPSYGFQKPKKGKDIFSWDSITPAHYGTYTFTFWNKTKVSLYVLDIPEGNVNVKYRNKNKAIIKPDSAVIMEVRLDSVRKGHFYESIGIHYRYQNKSEKYLLNMWGYQPKQRSVAVPRFQSFKDSLRVYIINKEEETLNNYRLRINNNSEIFYPKLEEENGNYVYKIRKENQDSIRYEIIDPQRRVINKGLLTIKYKDKSVFFYANTSLIVPHYYYMGSRPVPYNSIKNNYFLDWKTEFSVQEVIQYVESLGLEVTQVCKPLIKVKDQAQAISLHKKLTTSPYQIELLPLVEYERISPEGWGGGCRYYCNDFFVQFYPEVTDEEAETVMKAAGIYDFQKLVIYNGYKRYRFKVKQIVDLQYVKLLDHLYQNSVVATVEQFVLGVDGLD
jgi:hypothetical protein